MITTNNIVEYLRAGFPVIWIKTDEPERVQREVIPVIEAFNEGYFSTGHWNLIDQKDPMNAIKILDEGPSESVMFAYNFHWFIDKPPIVQAMKNSAPIWASSGKHFVIVSHTVKIPPELEKDILVMDMELMTDTEITSTIEYIADNNYAPSKKELPKIIRASRGLTRKELENVYSLSLVQHKRLDTATINDYKAQAISKSGYLKVLRTDKTFDSVIGYQEVKDQILETIDNPNAKGVMMVGPPGTGKTSLAEAITGQTGKFGVIVDMGKLFSKFIGDTDKNVDFVINTITTIGDCFVLIDEFEKQFAGASGEGAGDSGVTKRALSKWLNFLQDRPKGVYIAATANSFDGIPPEYLRPGRWDTAPFYIDLPSETTRLAILKHYATGDLAKGNLKNINKKLENFSGAEVEALVKVATMRHMSLLDAKRFIIPVAQTMSDKINHIRTWAQINCIPADNEIAEVVTRKLVLN